MFMEMDDSKPNLLVVEDNESNYLLLKILLRDHFNVKHAITGSDALKMVEESSFALVLMDIKLPDIDGIEITKRIKEIAPELPVIAQSAYIFPEINNKAIEAGCSCFISKPIKKDILYEAVKKYVRK
jgi:two-component system, cell cycle response regulator DivK